jgi:glycosyltransferase involved in cell wall biosynthesis
MFRKGRNCERQCGLCKLSSSYKAWLAKKIPALGFCSPSLANLVTLARFFPIRNRPQAAIMNVNRYPAATEARLESDHTRFLYAGRLHGAKGVDVLLAAAKKMAETQTFTMTVVGSGPDEAALRTQYGHLPWCRFVGFVPQQELSNIMANSDVLCVPSVWAENSPGVVIHALGLGLPVIGSRIGGIPELVEDGKNGLLVEAASVDAWRDALASAASDPARREVWRTYAHANAKKFDQDYLGAKTLAFFAELSGQ